MLPGNRSTRNTDRKSIGPLVEKFGQHRHRERCLPEEVNDVSSTSVETTMGTLARDCMSSSCNGNKQRTVIEQERGQLPQQQVPLEAESAARAV